MTRRGIRGDRECYSDCYYECTGIGSSQASTLEIMDKKATTSRDGIIDVYDLSYYS
jgi:hypothetical protein